ncbi:deoxynucleoside kinase [Mycoplasma sp. Mirounga ES2805-ORL]|uniref:deoxynucleoside kinase n=1 Tax=Mycoplasma sp. Mirounga ES2805-ORL TaxID=754514 RepID=UPI00197B467C|nr:deoxynucleoside kinase [Mycoplasma sp. Mirounga ES2805-ORL]QSF13982.1 deoxynucleoside kinase [Mycoplasma sp. Mirounga ES2805-ORL]
MVIGISGMIGCGKSTLSSELHDTYSNSLLLEEFSNDDVVFNTFLSWIYKKKPNIDIGFQTYIIESLSDSFKKAINLFNKKGFTMSKNHIFLDRFNLEHYIFAKVNLDKKDSKYFKAFDALFNCILNEEENPDLAIFLDIDFDTFKRRIFQRGRKSEIDNYDLNEAYFKELHSVYKDEFIKLVQRYNIPYKIIDCNNKTNDQVFDEAKNIIDNFDFSKSKRK